MAQCRTQGVEARPVAMRPGGRFVRIEFTHHHPVDDGLAGIVDWLQNLETQAAWLLCKSSSRMVSDERREVFHGPLIDLIFHNDAHLRHADSSTVTRSFAGVRRPASAIVRSARVWASLRFRSSRRWPFAPSPKAAP